MMIFTMSVDGLLWGVASFRNMVPSIFFVKEEKEMG